MDKLRDLLQKYGFWLLWLALAAALLVRVRYCTAGEEESYFLAEANAYLQGLVPIKEMWGGTYFSALIFMPLAALFRGLTGGYEGVFLFLRVCYILFTAGVSAVGYLALLWYFPKGRRGRAFGAFCVGGAAVLALFLAVLRVQAPFSVYLENLDTLFIRDAAHQGHGGLVSTLVAWLASCRYWYGLGPILAVGALWAAAGFARLAVCKGKKLPGWVWPVLWSGILAVAAWGLLLRPQGHMYYSNMKWFIPGLLWPAVFCVVWPRQKAPGLTLCLAGMCYAVGVFIGTDLGIVNASYGFYFCVVGKCCFWRRRRLKKSVLPRPGGRRWRWWRCCCRCSYATCAFVTIPLETRPAPPSRSRRGP